MAPSLHGKVNGHGGGEGTLLSSKLDTLTGTYEEPSQEVGVQLSPKAQKGTFISLRTQGLIAGLAQPRADTARQKWVQANCKLAEVNPL